MEKDETCTFYLHIHMYMHENNCTRKIPPWCNCYEKYANLVYYLILSTYVLQM